MLKKSRRGTVRSSGNLWLVYFDKNSVKTIMTQKLGYSGPHRWDVGLIPWAGLSRLFLEAQPKIPLKPKPKDHC